jgi:hypothetical protein
MLPEKEGDVGEAHSYRDKTAVTEQQIYQKIFPSCWPAILWAGGRCCPLANRGPIIALNSYPMIERLF